MIFVEAKGIKGLRPYYAPNPLRGGATKGARGGRVGENFEKRNAEGGNFRGGNLGREGGGQFLEIVIQGLHYGG